MRIITEGAQKITETVKRCYKCKTHYAYEPKDIQQDRDGRYVVCPKCNAFCAV